MEDNNFSPFAFFTMVTIVLALGNLLFKFTTWMVVFAPFMAFGLVTIMAVLVAHFVNTYNDHRNKKIK